VHGGCRHCPNLPRYVPHLHPSSNLACTNPDGGTTVPVQGNGVSTVAIGMYGAPVGMVATVQVTESRGTSPVWFTTHADGPIGRVTNITGTGFYRVNTSGIAQVRVVLSALSSGNAVIDFAGGVGMFSHGTFNLSKPTYSASFVAVAPAASATDIAVLQGSASAVVHLTRFECTGNSTSGGSKGVSLVTRSTANTGGTASVVTATPLDPLFPAAYGVFSAYTANPTVGTLVGTPRTSVLNLPAATATGASVTAWDFGPQSRNFAQDIVLRGAATSVALNGQGASFPAGSTLSCSAEWYED
jgi:hypothetical protein